LHFASLRVIRSPPEGGAAPPSGQSADVRGRTGADRLIHERKPHGAAAKGPQPVEIALLASVFVVAACGLVYELSAAALSSYLLGDSVLQFSTIIGTYLFAMGVGSWLSRYFDRQLPAHFLRIELLVALSAARCRRSCSWPTPTCRAPSACCCTAS
jgi:hypothetical protein